MLILNIVCIQLKFYLFYFKGNDTCIDGHTGVRCEECVLKEGYTKTYGGDCV